jgi:hypothetical protein
MPDALPPTIAQLDERIKKIEELQASLPKGATADQVKALEDQIKALTTKKDDLVAKDEARSFWDL